MLDRFDTAVHLYMFVPALAELWPASGMAPVKASIALYSGYLFTVFTLGWARSMFWNWPADRIGPVSVMCPALCGLAGALMFFTVFRFLPGIGVGSE